MKILFYVLVGIILFSYLGGLKIQINPFKISLENPFLAIGVTFLLLGVMCIMVDSYMDGFKRGYGKSKQDQQTINDIIHEANQNNQL